jgi:hypothetical protein
MGEDVLIAKDKGDELSYFLWITLAYQTPWLVTQHYKSDSPYNILIALRQIIRYRVHYWYSGLKLFPTVILPLSLNRLRGLLKHFLLNQRSIPQ